MVTCPRCRADVPAGARFCPECGQDLRLRGDERRIVTVLFADLVGYTALAETMDPEQVKNLIDGCFERLVTDIDAFGGRVDKIIGDAIVALFGAPVAHEDDAERAVRAALRMQQTLDVVSSELALPVRMRVGVNTGEVLVGALRAGGSTTAMGDVVNTANRLQAAAQPGEVLVGATTYAATRRTVLYDEVDPIDAKGKEDLVPAWRANDAVAPPGYRPERNRARLIGREPELGLLCSSVENAIRNARASLLLMLGEAGVGKSRLAEELASHAEREHNALILEGRCVPYGEANVWWPVADALRHGCGIRSSDPADKAIELARTSVCIALGEGAAPTEVDRVHQGLLYLMGYDSELRGIDATRARDEAIDAVATYAERFSLHRPVVVVLSDLHWADDLVLGLVDTMLERLAARRFVVLATARPIIEERWHPPHGRHNLVVLTLDTLTPDAAALLLCELAGEELSAGLARALLERSGGNPFFLEELVTLLTDAGMVGADGGEGRGAGQGLEELPDTLRGLVAARLDGLTPDERRVLDDCAVLGRRGPISAIEVMSKKHNGISGVRPILESLEAKELLTLSGTGDGEKWTFRSDLVREVAYSTLTKSDRARSHQGIAIWIEDHEDADRDVVLDRIAHHYVRAAELANELGPVGGLVPDLQERALSSLERAAARANQAEIPVVAERLYGEGLRLLAGHHGPRHRAFLTGRARALAGLRDIAPARADAEAAIVESRTAGLDGDADLGRALLVLADIEQKESRWPAAEQALAEAAEVFARLGDKSGEAEVLRLRGFGALFRHEYAAATALLEQALAGFEALEDQRGVAWALQNLAWCAFYSGQAEKAEHQLHRAATTFEELGDQGGLRWAQGLLAWTRFQLGYAAEAEAMADEILADDRRGGDRWAIGMMLVLSGSARLWTGRTASAVERLREARALFDGIGEDFGYSQAAAVLGRALVLAGHVQEGLDTVALIRQDGDDLTDRQALVVTMAGLSATVQVGDVARSQALLGGAPGALDNLGDDGLLVGDTERVTAIGLLRLQLGDVEGAVSVLDALDRQLHPTVDPNLHSALALAHAATGALDDALREADEVDLDPRASYLDCLTAGVARGLALARRGDVLASVAAFDQVRAAADATEDKVNQALVRLADATAAAALGGADAPERMARAEARLTALGIEDTGWRQAYRLATGLAPVT